MTEELHKKGNGKEESGGKEAYCQRPRNADNGAGRSGRITGPRLDSSQRKGKRNGKGQGGLGEWSKSGKIQAVNAVQERRVWEPSNRRHDSEKKKRRRRKEEEMGARVRELRDREKTQKNKNKGPV